MLNPGNWWRKEQDDGTYFKGICRYIGNQASWSTAQSVISKNLDNLLVAAILEHTPGRVRQLFGQMHAKARATMVSSSRLLQGWSKQRIRQVGNPTQPREKQRKKRTQGKPLRRSKQETLSQQPRPCAVCWIMRQREQTEDTGAPKFGHVNSQQEGASVACW